MTGNATVSGNTTGGNAKSGNANTAVNIANLMNDQLNLSNWFGVLFINIFGNWMGSMGPFVQTPISSVSPAGPFNFVPNDGPAKSSNNSIRFSSLDSSSDPSTSIPIYNLSSGSLPTQQNGNTSNANQGNQPSSTLASVSSISSSKTKKPIKNSGFSLLVYIVIGIGVALLGVERILSYKKTSK